MKKIVALSKVPLLVALLNVWLLVVQQKFGPIDCHEKYWCCFFYSMNFFNNGAKFSSKLSPCSSQIFVLLLHFSFKARRSIMKKWVWFFSYTTLVRHRWPQRTEKALFLHFFVSGSNKSQSNSPLLSTNRNWRWFYWLWQNKARKTEEWHEDFFCIIEGIYYNYKLHTTVVYVYLVHIVPCTVLVFRDGFRIWTFKNVLLITRWKKIFEIVYHSVHLLCLKVNYLQKMTLA